MEKKHTRHTFLISKNTWQIRHFLTQNNRGCTRVELLRESATYIIPLCCPGAIADHVTTFLLRIAWFGSSPCCVTGQRSVICPIELRVCLTMESQPNSIPRCKSFLLAKKIIDELIFGGRCDLGEACTKLSAFFQSMVSMHGWSVDDEVT